MSSDQRSNPTPDAAPSSQAPSQSTRASDNGTRSTGRNSRNARNNQRATGPRFKGAVETLATLGTRAERQDKDQFIRFQEDLKNYVMREFKQPQDIVVVIKDLKDPAQVLRDNIPKMSKMLEEFGLDETNKLDEENADTFEAVKELFKQAMGTFSKRRDQLNQNQTKLYGTVWGQCSPALQSKVIGDLEYKAKAKEYACL